ncbi:hypothetical protein CWC14_04075 [Pseudoalteromonas sp. S3260]|nr:hypothetical protein [Pseudoalteromonas sp. S3260]TMO99738.1 hypothetical protein CWC14_04075 [Pseudoalteromonas sp. S3260]
MNSSDMRIGNQITVLVPANKYEFNCAWTEEKLLPALELFTCKLLLILEKISPNEISSYFGLNTREIDQLINNLMSNKLISLDSEGLLIPTSMLKQQTSKGDEVTLTNYVERNETAIFDSFTHSIRKDRGFNYRLLGLPELPVDSKKTAQLEDAISHFSAQYKTHLNLSRRTEKEVNRTKLYKVVSAINRGIIQFPVDIEFHYAPSDMGQLEVKRITRASEYINNTLQLPLSTQLEAHIADYLGSIPRSEEGITAEEYCTLVKDEVLKQFVTGNNIDYSGWLNAREDRKTGYGNQLTKSIFGPVYIDKNYVTLMRMLNESLHANGDSNAETFLKAYWLASNVSLWGANSHSLISFCDKIKKTLIKYDDSADLIMVHHGKTTWDDKEFREFHKNHTSFGLMTSNELDRLEVFLIPNILGVVQYHGYPNSKSGVSVPIGYATVDSDRLKLLENLLNSRIGGSSELKVSWPKKAEISKLMMPDREQKNTSPLSNRPILSLKKD